MAVSFLGIDQGILTRISSEQDRRNSRESALPTAEASAPADGDPRLAIDGSAIVFVYAKGSVYEDALRSALDGGEAAQSFAVSILQLAAAQQPIDAGARAELALRAPVIACLKFNGQPLVNQIFIDDIFPIFTTILPYTGGALPFPAFSLEEFYLDNAESLEGKVILTPPKLNDAERAMVDLVPANMRGLNVGTPDSYATVAALGIAAVAATAVTYAATPAGAIAQGLVAGAVCPAVAATAYAAASTGGPGRPSCFSRPGLITTQEELDALGPAGSVQQLVQRLASQIVSPVQE